MMSSLRSAITVSVSRVLSLPQTTCMPSRMYVRLLRSYATPRVSMLNRRFPVAVTCHHIHTTGDKELVEFLKDEIKMEKANKGIGKLPKIKGFEIIASDGPNVTLKKTLESESVTIKFNINNSVDDAMSGVEADNQQEQAPDTKMISKPAFLVEINKGGNQTLAIQCVFPPSDEYPAGEHEESYVDLIEIQDVALLNKSQEWTDDVYSLSASVMDGNLYDMLMKMLEERGIDADFIDQLTDFSTTYEHTKYVDTLEKLKDFVDSK
jgi:hypothetical protein